MNASTLRDKWHKGLRAWRLRAEARTQVANARRRDGRDGPACLVTNLAQMGDVVLSAGIVRALRERLPRSPLLFAGQPRWLEILEGDPCVDGLLGARTLFEVRHIARSRIFDTVYMLDIPIPTLLSYLDGVPSIFRYAPPTTADWFIQGKNLMALYEQNAGLAEGSARPHVWLRPEDHAGAEAIWTAEKLPVRDQRGESPVLALHTQSSEPTKNWPAERFAALVARWQAVRGARFVIVGGPGEAVSLEGLAGVTHLAGRLSIKQTAAVIARCDFFVGLDSGLAYVAEAVGIPGLVILGATSSRTCGPRADNFSFIRAPNACDPACHRVCTRRPFCVATLSMDAVDDALEAAYRRYAAQRDPLSHNSAVAS